MHYLYERITRAFQTPKYTLGAVALGFGVGFVIGAFAGGV